MNSIFNDLSIPMPSKDIFDDRYWGPATAAQKAKLRAGGSITFTGGKCSNDHGR